MERRAGVAFAFMRVTLAFAAGLPRVQIKTRDPDPAPHVNHDTPMFYMRNVAGVVAPIVSALVLALGAIHRALLRLVNLAIVVIAALAYRSLVAGPILLVPVNLSDFMLGAAMVLFGIGLAINPTIVAVMGIGIDCGICLPSRIHEAYAARGGDLRSAISKALTTTGEAVLFTATIMLINMVLPLTVGCVKPRFLARRGLLVGENIDLAELVTASRR